MLAYNFTGEQNEKTVHELYCSKNLTGEIHSHLIVVSLLNVFVALSAFSGNALIIAALCKESLLTLHPPSKLLYRNLAMTDVCVSVIALPVNITYWTSTVIQQWNICRYALDLTIITSFPLCGVSLLTSTAISVDRLLALLLGLRYRQIVTLKRTYMAVAIFWFAPIFCITMYYFIPSVASLIANTTLLLCLITSILSYAKIFRTLRLRHNHFQVQDHSPEQPAMTRVPLNMARYRKAVYSALWVQTTLVICYLPFGLTFTSASQEKITSAVYLARQYTGTLIYFNSSLNPLLYCWKIPEIRRAVKDTLKQLCCL